MGKMTRRTFIKGSTGVAAGVALGISASEGIRRHGPVRIQTYFLTKDPIVIEGSLLTDAHRDLFRIYALVEPKYPPVIAEMSLSDMRMAVETGSGSILLVMKGYDKKTERAPVSVKVDRENVTFVFGGSRKDSAPVWLPLSDVQKVL